MCRCIPEGRARSASQPTTLSSHRSHALATGTPSTHEGPTLVPSDNATPPWIGWPDAWRLADIVRLLRQEQRPWRAPWSRQPPLLSSSRALAAEDVELVEWGAQWPRVSQMCRRIV
jgi:hypothetical protein